MTIREILISSGRYTEIEKIVAEIRGSEYYAETYYAYTGSKKITSGMGFGFELVTNWLVRYR